MRTSISMIMIMKNRGMQAGPAAAAPAALEKPAAVKNAAGKTKVFSQLDSTVRFLAPKGCGRQATLPMANFENLI